MGRVIEVNVGQGKPILKSFMDSGFPVDFSDTVPEGRRAMTVQVDEVNAVAGFIRPGNRVDLFVNIAYNLSGFSSGFITADLIGSLPSDLRDSIPPALLDAVLSAPPDDTSAQTLTGSAIPKDVILPVLQNVRVLATGRDPYREQLDKLRYPQQRTERNFNNVTVDVTPREAALLAAAIDVGDLLAILRNRDDESSAAFTTVSARDLFNNASEMARAEEERKTRVATAAGVDADGNKLMSREQLAQAGLSVNANGELVDADGNVVDPDDVIVTADGRVLRKSELAAAGLAVNENGQIIDANGNVVSAEDVVVTASGEVMTKQELAAAGLSVNENGEIVDANGRVVDAAKLVKTADGKILTAEALAAAGLTVNENGEIVDENGNVVDPETLIVSADGKVLSKAQLAAAGLSVNENGEIVDADGNVIDPNELVVGANGEVITAKALAAAGLSINENGQIVDENGNVVDPSALAGGIARLIDLYIGGGSSDGVAKKAVLRTSD